MFPVFAVTSQLWSFERPFGPSQVKEKFFPAMRRAKHDGIK